MLNRLLLNGSPIDVYPCVFSRLKCKSHINADVTETYTLSTTQVKRLNDALKTVCTSMVEKSTIPKKRNESVMIAIGSFLSFVEGKGCLPLIIENHIKTWEKAGARCLCFSRVYVDEMKKAV